jgi:CheY-like chemotaxis protein/HPt (histidine-containing phosphotransfer) domain-containing protein
MNLAAAETPPAAMPPLRRPDGARPRLLLAEDSEAARLLTAALIERMGCVVDAVVHGEDAVARVRDCDYDLIMLDIEMPVMDGVTAARSIRALGGTAGQTPIVALSAFLADSSRSTAWRQDFDFALAKPAGRKELRHAIAGVLDARWQSIVPVTEPDFESDALFDAQAMQLMAGSFNRESWHVLTALVAEEIMACIHMIESAKSSYDRRQVRRAAHKLKGIALSFSAIRLAAMAKQAETGPADPYSLRDCAAQTLAAMRGYRFQAPS